MKGTYCDGKGGWTRVGDLNVIVPASANCPPVIHLCNPLYHNKQTILRRHNILIQLKYSFQKFFNNYLMMSRTFGKILEDCSDKR